MKIVDAFTGRQVAIGDTLPAPGGGTYRIAEITPGPALRALNELGYTLFGKGLVQPKIRVVSDHPHLNGQWIPLAVNAGHPSYPNQVVAFIPS